MKLFKTVSGTPIKNVSAYVLDVLEKHPTSRIYIGTDSQRVGRKVNIATVIAFRYGTRGVHFIHSFERRKPFRDVGERLRYEVEQTADIITWWTESLPAVKIEAVEVDVNKSERYKSNKVHKEAVGWLKGLVPDETRVVSKPDLDKVDSDIRDCDLLVAVRAANHLV